MKTRLVGRRAVMKGSGALAGAALLGPFVGRGSASTSRDGVTWVATTQASPWQSREAGAGSGGVDVDARLDLPMQTIDGFGACFNELGWTSLSHLPEADRASILHELFAPGEGANFTICRMPVGANDFSRDWYSYDEEPGDFELRRFSIEHDLDTLVPFVKAALAHQPRLRVWASPWSPPTWMKTNHHYAAAMPQPGAPPNGLTPDQIGREGTDMFVQEERYLAAYATYFRKFVAAYRERGISVAMVMPQNEFNSAQPFPSCTWTPEGLARFIGFLGPEMRKIGVEVFFGTMERPDERLFDVSMHDPKAAAYLSGAGFQWAGKGAIAGVHRRYPSLKLYQTEQECGDGKNDWRYCRYAWTLMKHYLGNGAGAYQYWNISLAKGGVSRWGWAQNSLVTVDSEAKTYRFNHEYYLLKHVSRFVRPGARRVQTVSWPGYENLLGFLNPDGSAVAVLQNDSCEEMPVRVRFGDTIVAATLQADSFNTIVVRT